MAFSPILLPGRNALFVEPLGGLGGGTADPNPAYLIENADLYINKDSVFAGTESAVTSFTSVGTIAVPFVSTGAGGEILKVASGFRFQNAKYGRRVAADGTMEGVLLIAQFTIKVPPASGVSYPFYFDGTAGSQAQIRYQATPLVSGVGPNTTILSADPVKGVDEVQTIGLLIDPEGRILTGGDQMMLIGADGWTRQSPITGVAGSIVLNDMRIGFTGDFILHQAAAFTIPVGGPADLPETALQLWSRVSGITPPQYDALTLRGSLDIGQSGPLGVSVSATEAQPYNYANRHGVWMLGGLVRLEGAVQMGLSGPQSGNYDDSIPATGLIPAFALSNLCICLPANLALQTIKGEGGPPIVTQYIGIAGQPISAFQDGASSIFSNAEYWLSQVAAQLVATSRTMDQLDFYFGQGEADKSAASGVWRAGFETFHTDLLAAIATALPGVTVRTTLGQVAGDGNTTSVGENWHVCNEQLDWADDNGAPLIPIYPHEVSDDDGHITFPGFIAYQIERAWAIDELDNGRTWNLGRPTIDLTAGTITLDLPGLRLDESLTSLNSATKYPGGGITNLGFEVVGATITNVQVNARSIVITTSGGTPTELRYAMQIQNVTGLTESPRFNAHRGVICTTLTKTIVVAGITYTARRWLPSFTADLT